MLGAWVAVGLWLLVAHAAAQPRAPATSQGVVRPPDRTELLWPAHIPPGTIESPVILRGHDMGLISAGVTMMSLGMSIGIAIASADLADGNCEEFFPTFRKVACGGAPYSLIPFAGSILAAAVQDNGGLRSAWPVVFGIVGSAVQLVGFVFTLIGVHGNTEELVPAVEVEGLALRLTPYATETGAGAQVSFAW